jgi:cytochrome c553
MTLNWKCWRPLVCGLAVATLGEIAFFVSASFAQDMPVAERIALCGSCHGEDGNSQLEKIPSLAGQPEFFLANQLILMREGVRQVPAMMPFVKDLTDPDIASLAKHYAGLEAKPSDEPVDAALAERGAKIAATRHCASCHRPDLSGQDQMPRVARQRIDYMIEAMIAFRDNTRSGADTAMSAAVYGLSDADIAALAHYGASR